MNKFKFGKHKGLTVKQVIDIGEDSYLKWLLEQDWFREKNEELHKEIINHFSLITVDETNTMDDYGYNDFTADDIPF